MISRNVQILHAWNHKKSEDLGTVLRRSFDAALLAQLGPPEIGLLAVDSPVGGGVSAVARAVKKHPELAPLRQPYTSPGATSAVDSLTTRTATGNTPISTDVLLALADGVPRSLPFNQVSVGLTWPEPGAMTLHVWDNWWVSGRMRSSTLAYCDEVGAGAKVLPPPHAGVLAILAAFGKPKSTTRLPLAGGSALVVPEGLGEIVQKHRALWASRVGAVTLPHVLDTAGLGEAAGPMKPLLVEVFGPQGYRCEGAHGAFRLRRRTSTHNVVELSLDVGTWSHQFTGYIAVHGPGFRATLPLMVAGTRGQIPIRGPEGWRMIVENLAVIVAILESEFVPDVEAAAGPAPAWYEPPPV